MIVVDSSALVAILRWEPEADQFAQIIAATVCLLSSVSLLETSLVMAGQTGTQSDWVELDRLVRKSAFEIIAHDADLMVVARDAFLRFGKGRHPAALNLGDCATYALAKSRDLPLLCKGRGFGRTDLVSAS